MSFIDANVIVYATVPDARNEEAGRALLGGGFTNTTVLAEAHRAILKITKDRTVANDAVNNVRKQLEILPVTEDDIAEAMQHTEIDIFDAIHIVTAQGSEFVTYDKELKAYAKKTR